MVEHLEREREKLGKEPEEKKSRERGREIGLSCRGVVGDEVGQTEAKRRPSIETHEEELGAARALCCLGGRRRR